MSEYLKLVKNESEIFNEKKIIEINKTTKCDCDFDSQIAYVIDKIGDEPINFISIFDYLKSKSFRKKIETKEKFLVCENGNELIKNESNNKKSHFKHKVYNNSEMSEWHKNWQNEFSNTEIQIGKRYADAVEGDYVLEFQHSPISKDLVISRNENYKSNNKKLLWIIDGNENIDIEEIDNDRIMLKFSNSLWKYDSFLANDFIFINKGDKIFKINPSLVKSNMIDIKEYKLKNEFIEAVKNNLIDNLWSIDELTQCVLYHNQRGAGCGKTYESIQLLFNNKFTHKDTFIYLTKMHSAKEVIYGELKSQYERGDLTSLELDKNDCNDGEIGIIDKQYQIKYINAKTQKECRVIIGTIDSFMFSVNGNKKINDIDYFNGIVKDIRDNENLNTKKNGSMNYSKNTIKLNKRCLIIIDEAQDLGPEYIEAVGKIMRNTYIDTYVIGDKLQSITDEHNIHTFLEKNDLPTIKIKRSIDEKNQIKRFHNEQFKDFVNNIIDFKKHNLYPISNVCDKTNCECGYKHDNEIKPYQIFQYDYIRPSDTDETKIDLVVDRIIKIIDKEIKENNYLPKNFMFIFPILKKNCLATRIETRLQEYWMNKFNDENYQNKVLKNDNYWKDKINNNEFYKYIYLHKSEEGTSINLKESENASRILSIHASKGNGCENVFLLGMDENSLRKFSKEKNNLQYESLLHVALTRQKKKIFIGLPKGGGDIYNRFTKFKTEDDEITYNLYDIKKNHKNICDDISDDIDIYKIIGENIIEKNNYKDLIPENKSDKLLIDIGHHLIRNCVFKYYVNKCLINENIKDNNGILNYKEQYIAELYGISKISISFFTYKDYYNEISNDKINNNMTYFPVLYFETGEKTKYNKYKYIIKDIIDNIKLKIKQSFNNNDLPKLCPIEIVILYHMIFIRRDGRYSEISIMDIYSLIYCYDECSNSFNENHDNFKCICKKCFTSGNKNKDSIKYKDIRQSITNHYENMKHIENICENYNKYIKDNYNEKFNYNHEHKINYKSENDNFNIYNNVEIIGYSNSHVIYFLLTTQFNKINVNEKILEGIVGNYILSNTQHFGKSVNHTKFLGKKIHICILTLDSLKPIFIDLNIDKDNKYLNDTFDKVLTKKYNSYHNDIYNFCLNYEKERPKNINLPKFIFDRMELETKMPKYIKDYFNDIQNDYKNASNKKLPKKYVEELLYKIRDRETFIKELSISLKISIDEYIYNKKEEIYDEYADL